jgi:hypothetical protein
VAQRNRIETATVGNGQQTPTPASLSRPQGPPTSRPSQTAQTIAAQVPASANQQSQPQQLTPQQQTQNSAVTTPLSTKTASSTNGPVRKSLALQPKPTIQIVSPPGEQSDLRAKKSFFEKAAGTTAPVAKSPVAQTPQDIPTTIDDSSRSPSKPAEPANQKSSKPQEDKQNTENQAKAGVASIETNVDSIYYTFDTAQPQQGKPELYKGIFCFFIQSVY